MWIRNRNGCIRWMFIREAYQVGWLGIEEIPDIYREWRDSREDLWLDGYNSNDKFVETVFVKASKRGNDVYKEHMKFKFRFLDNLPQIEFFKHNSHGVKHTKMIFVTLTVNSNKYSLNDSWEFIASELHLFEAKLRQEYGEFRKFRVWEVHESGYPHCHIIYYFPNKEFRVFRHVSKKRFNSKGAPKVTWRLINKYRDKIRGFWSFGQVDIQAVSDTKGAFSEVKKYITKYVWSDKGDITNSMLCLFAKQSYWISSCNLWKKVDNAVSKGVIGRSVKARSDYVLQNVDDWCSKDFVGCIWGMEFYLMLYNGELSNGLAEPTVADDIRNVLCNCNKEIPEIAYFKFCGVFLHDDLKLLVTEFGDDYEIHAKPPPEVRFYFGIDKPQFSFEKRYRTPLFMEDYYDD